MSETRELIAILRRIAEAVEENTKTMDNVADALIERNTLIQDIFFEEPEDDAADGHLPAGRILS